MLDATAHILAEGHPLTTNRVAEVAGVSIGSLYQYFPSKEALVAALVERMLNDDLAFVEASLVPGPLRAQIPDLVRAVCERQSANAGLMAAILPMLPIVERDALAAQAFEQMAAWLEVRIAEEQGLRPELADPERLRMAVFVASRSMRWVLNEAAREQPAWLAESAFQAELVRLVDGLWRPSTAPE